MQESFGGAADKMLRAHSIVTTPMAKPIIRELLIGDLFIIRIAKAGCLSFNLQNGQTREHNDIAESKNPKPREETRHPTESHLSVKERNDHPERACKPK